jgi:hypothetical protein
MPSTLTDADLWRATRREIAATIGDLRRALPDLADDPHAYHQQADELVMLERALGHLDARISGTAAGDAHDD